MIIAFNSLYGSSEHINAFESNLYFKHIKISIKLVFCDNEPTYFS